MKQKRKLGWMAIAFGVVEAVLVAVLGNLAYQGIMLHRHVHIPVIIVSLAVGCFMLAGLSVYSWWRG